MEMRIPLMILCGLSLVASGCTKEPGVGGKARLEGVVMRQDVNAAGAPVGAAYPYQEARVYIIYGDGAYSNDDVRTGPDGGYSFPWLRKGDYTVYIFGECNCPGKSIEVEQQVHIDGKKDVVTVPTMTALNF